MAWFDEYENPRQRRGDSLGSIDGRDIPTGHVSDVTESESGFSAEPSFMTPVEPPVSSDLQFPRPFVTGGGPAHWAQGEILRRQLDDVSDWTPDHPTWADIRAGVREMAVGVWQGVADYLTGGRRP